MTKVKYQIKDGYYEKIIISGHANFAYSGKDIVCASISSIITTTINAVIRLDEKALFYQEKDALMEIDIKIKNDITNILIINMMELLDNLSKKYPKNLEIRKMV